MNTFEPLILPRKPAAVLFHQNKEASTISRMPDDEKKWPAHIFSELLKELPYLARYDVEIVLDRMEPEAGAALGFAQVSTKTTSRPQEAVLVPGNVLRIPLIVQDRRLQKFHIFEAGGQTYPLTEERVQQAMLNPAIFDTDASRMPSSPSLLDQIYPPYQQRQGFGRVSEPAAMGLSKISSVQMDKQAIFGFSAQEREQKDLMRRSAAWVAEMNVPANIDKINNLMVQHAGKPHNQMSEEEWQTAKHSALSHPHFHAIHEKHFGAKWNPLTGYHLSNRMAVWDADGSKKEAGATAATAALGALVGGAHGALRDRKAGRIASLLDEHAVRTGAMSPMEQARRAQQRKNHTILGAALEGAGGAAMGGSVAHLVQKHLPALKGRALDAFSREFQSLKGELGHEADAFIRQRMEQAAPAADAFIRQRMEQAAPAADAFIRQRMEQAAPHINAASEDAARRGLRAMEQEAVVRAQAAKVGLAERWRHRPRWLGGVKEGAKLAGWRDTAWYYAKDSLSGGGVGAVLGAAVGASANPEDRKRGALRGALRGAGVGAVAFPATTALQEEVLNRAAYALANRGHVREGDALYHAAGLVPLLAGTAAPGAAAGFRKRDVPVEKSADHVPVPDPQVVNTALQHVLINLLALHQLYYFAYWTSQEQPFYGDRLLFTRLYENVQKEFNSVAERLIGAGGGNQAFDPTAIFPEAAAQSARWLQAGSSIFQAAATAEEALQAALLEAHQQLDATGGLSLGIDDLLMSIASAHDTHLYLLRQREGGALTLPAQEATVPPTQEALAAIPAVRQQAPALQV